MATKTIVTTHSDLSNQEGAEPVSFTYAGNNMVIDLTADERKEFDSIMDRYARAGRRASTSTSKSKSSTASSNTSGVDNAAVRVWAAERGKHLATRGRLPASVVAEYLEAIKTVSQARQEAALVKPTPAPKVAARSHHASKPAPVAVLDGVTGKTDPAVKPPSKPRASRAKPKPAPKA
jgi:Lsr2